MCKSSLSSIAVVEDDALVRRSFERLLRAAGMQAVGYESAEAFLADAKRPRFDCLVLDVHLGGMSGIELARLLCADPERHIPAICITAHDEPDTRAAAQSAGCVGFFHKTEPGADVLEAIRRVIV
ncbi:MAG: response regulator [Rubrivivax sp.]|nr:response regulator [Rubrivivax sp.]